MSSLRCQFPPECPPEALFDCDYVFSDVVVIPAREGGMIVQWVLHPQVRDYGEYRYTLQVGNAGVDDPRAWKSIVSETDVWFLEDPKRRLPGVFAFTHYRVRLDMGERTYHSRPVPAMGRLGYEDAGKS